MTAKSLLKATVCAFMIIENLPEVVAGKSIWEISVDNPASCKATIRRRLADTGERLKQA